jgi:hypothetical protein
MNNTAHSDIARLTDEIESQLLQLYRSPILTGDELRAALGFKSLDALRQSIARGTLPVPLFSMKNRRGKYALTKEVAQCLANERILNRCE